MAAPDVPDWTRCVQLIGKDPSGNPILIATDANGNIVAVMKGEYAGALKTIAVDASGRVIMIPTDPADVWGNAISMGNAELAARLRPLYAYDYRGSVIWATDFGSGLQGSTFGVDHTDSIGILSSSRAFSGAYSIKLDPRAVDDAYVDWTRIISFLSTGRVGFYTPISLDADPSSVRWRMIYYDGSNALTAYLLFTPSTGTWQIYIAGPAWTDILTGFKLYPGASAWHHVKLVINPSTEKYVRVLVDKQSVDLSAYSLVKTTDTTIGQLLASVRCNALVATHAPIYIGGSVLTQNEPA